MVIVETGQSYFAAICCKQPRDKTDNININLTAYSLYLSEFG